MPYGLRSLLRLLPSKPAERKRRPIIRPRLERLEDRLAPSADSFVQTNLVSDVAGMAATTDPQLINPWGLTASSSSPFWVADNQNGLSTLYNGQGVKQGLVVNIPSASNSSFTHATPTGTVFNTDTNSSDFNVTDAGTTARSNFLFDTLDGTIDGWSGGNNAVIAVQTPGAVYTGLAIDTSASAGNTLLYAADWGKGVVEVYNGNFQQVDVGAFQDKAIPSNFHPFNVQDINGNIFVTYAQFDPTTGGDTGTGGFVAEFTRDGTLKATLTGNGQFNSPWGVALAPAGFGDLGGDLLVGNFGGDGHINAFNPNNNFQFVTSLKDASGNPLAIDNLWALRFGNGGAAGSPNTLFFTAGITDAPATIFGATDGLLGSLQAIPPVPQTTPILPNLGNFPQQSISTVASNGDVNPYGVAFVPQNFQGGGKLAPGDILVSNFNDSGNTQGTGSSIVVIGPNGQQSTFFQGAPGLGLTTALGVLPQGFVLVGTAPATTVNGVNTVGDGALLILDSNGNQVGQISDSALLQGPWDLTIHNVDNTHAQVFVSNVLSGTVTRLDLFIPSGGMPMVQSETQIASGFAHRTDPNALVVGPTGLAFDANSGILYVASTGDNAIHAIANAATTQNDERTGAVVVQDAQHLHGPLGLVLAPNGNLIVANGDAQNPDPNHPNELVEYTPTGTFIGQFQVDPGAPGGAFGIAVQQVGDPAVRFAAVDDNTNTLEVWTFQTQAPPPGPPPQPPPTPPSPPTPPPPLSLPASVRQQLLVDGMLLSNFTGAGGQASLVQLFDSALALAVQQSPSLVIALLQKEARMWVDLAFGQMAAAIADANVLAADPLYNTPLGYGLGLIEGELILSALTGNS